MPESPPKSFPGFPCRRQSSALLLFVSDSCPFSSGIARDHFCRSSLCIGYDPKTRTCDASNSLICGLCPIDDQDPTPYY